MRKFVILLSVLFLASLFSTSVFAEQLDEAGNSLVIDFQSNTPVEKTPTPNWGTTSSVVQVINSGSCTPTRSAYTYDQFYSWRWCTTGSSCWFDCSAHLPAGAKVDMVEVEYYDNDAVNNVYYNFMVCPETVNSCTYYGTDTPAGTPGRTYNRNNISASNIVIDNNNNNYALRVGLGGDSNTQFRSVLVYYTLQVSAAPATATFSDVPTSHMFFQYIEALAAAGITTGYPDGTYGPDNYVTRGQMAVFLSRGFGLHWPN